MDALLFAYWLQGYVEMGGQCPTEYQWKMIKEHLALVFNKVTSQLEGQEPVEVTTKAEDNKTVVTDWSEEIKKALEKGREQEPLIPNIGPYPHYPHYPTQPSYPLYPGIVDPNKLVITC